MESSAAGPTPFTLPECVLKGRGEESILCGLHSDTWYHLTFKERYLQLTCMFSGWNTVVQLTPPLFSLYHLVRMELCQSLLCLSPRSSWLTFLSPQQRRSCSGHMKIQPHSKLERNVDTLKRVSKSEVLGMKKVSCFLVSPCETS